MSHPLSASEVFATYAEIVARRPEPPQIKPEDREQAVALIETLVRPFLTEVNASLQAVIEDVRSGEVSRLEEAKLRLLQLFKTKYRCMVSYRPLGSENPASVSMAGPNLTLNVDSDLFMADTQPQKILLIKELVHELSFIGIMTAYRQQTGDTSPLTAESVKNYKAVISRAPVAPLTHFVDALFVQAIAASGKPAK